MSRVRWLPEARADLLRLSTFIADENPAAARRAIRAIHAGTVRLGAHPEIGRRMRDGGPERELVIRFGGGAYVLRYRIDVQGDAIIIRV